MRSKHGVCRLVSGKFFTTRAHSNEFGRSALRSEGWFGGMFFIHTVYRVQSKVGVCVCVCNRRGVVVWFVELLLWIDGGSKCLCLTGNSCALCVCVLCWPRRQPLPLADRVSFLCTRSMASSREPTCNEGTGAPVSRGWLGG